MTSRKFRIVILVVDLIKPLSSLFSLISRKKAKISRMRRVLADGGVSKVARDGCSKSVFSSYLPSQSPSTTGQGLTQVVDGVDSGPDERAADKIG